MNILRPLRGLTPWARYLALASGGLSVAFLVLLAAGWSLLPAEGAKLHGNVDTGIDLVGRRTDLLWLFAAAIILTGGNGALAVFLRPRAPMAARFLLGNIPVLLGGFLGALWFIILLNRPG